MQWYDEIDWRKSSSDETILIIETVGIDTFFKLNKKMEKDTYYFAKRNLYRIQRQYIMENVYRHTTKEFMKILGCKEGFTRKTIKEAKRLYGWQQLKLEL